MFTAHRATHFPTTHDNSCCACASRVNKKNYAPPVTLKTVPTGVGGKRGPGSRSTGYGVLGCGKLGVWCKTRGLSAKHGEPLIISSTNEVEMLLYQIAMKINRREMRLLVTKAN